MTVAAAPSSSACSGRGRRPRVMMVAQPAAPGTVISARADGVRVACGSGQLCLTELQRPGGKRLGAADFLRGFALQAGQSLKDA